MGGYSITSLYIRSASIIRVFSFSLPLVREGARLLLDVGAFL